MEGYHDLEGRRVVRLYSISTLRQAYGKAELEAIVTTARNQVGQGRITAKYKKQKKDDDVRDYLESNGVHL